MYVNEEKFKKSHSIQLEQELYTAQIKYKITTKIISILEEHIVSLLTLLDASSQKYFIHDSWVRSVSTMTAKDCTAKIQFLKGLHMSSASRLFHPPTKCISGLILQLYYNPSVKYHLVYNAWITP